MKPLHWLLSPVPLLLLVNLGCRLAAAQQKVLPLDETRNFTVSSSTPLEILVKFLQLKNETTALRLETIGYSNETLLLIARQQLILHTWSLPFIFVDADELGDEKPVESFQSAGRTLCPPQLWPQQQQQQVLLQVSTQSAALVTLSARAQLASNFRLSLGDTIKVLLQPSSPQLFFFDFNDSAHLNTTDLRAVRVLVESNDSACGLVSLQGSPCPAQQTLPSVLQRGFRQTLLSSSVIFMRRDEFSSFLVVLLAFPDDRKCLPNWKQGERQSFLSKTVTLTVEQIPMQDSEVWALVSLFLILTTVCWMLAILVVLCTYCECNCNELKGLFLMISRAGLIIFVFFCIILVDTTILLAVVLLWFLQSWQIILTLSIVACVSCACIILFLTKKMKEYFFSYRRSSTESEQVAISSAVELREGYGSTHSLGQLQEPGTTDHKVRVSHALQLLVIAIFYCLPVVQLVLLLQKSLHSGGNLDDCYYNYKCRYTVKTSAGTIYAFNNVVSNGGYLAAGVVFMLTVLFKEKLLDANLLDPKDLKPVVIPRCYSAHYAAGLALAMEGVLSACYHICPSSNTFQFDTAFMLMLASMLGLAVYSKRNLSAGSLSNVTFVALGVTVGVNSLGILISNTSRLIPFVCLGVALLAFPVGLAIYFKQNFRKRSDFKIAVFLNIALGIICFVFGLIGESRFLFADMVLTVVFVNAGVYFLYYCFRKYAAKTSANEADHLRSRRVRCCMLSVLLFLSSTAIMIWALVYFLNAPTDWNQSPAESRNRNNGCYVRWFGLPFDQHDLWHLLGSGALLCLLLLVLFMDFDEERLKLTEERIF